MSIVQVSIVKKYFFLNSCAFENYFGNEIFLFKRIVFAIDGDRFIGSIQCTHSYLEKEFFKMGLFVKCVYLFRIEVK